MYVPVEETSDGTELLRFTFSFRTKTDENNIFTEYRLRFALRGDLQKVFLLFDPANLSSPVAEHDAMRIAMADTFANDYIMEHFSSKRHFQKIN